MAEPFLDLTVEGLDDASAGAVIGSFIAVLLLFAPPVVLLGMVSPFAIRLAVSTIETAGAVAGRLYALSTAGSLLGTFLPALILIPAIGTQRTFVVIAALLAASASFLLGVRYLVVAGLLAALVHPSARALSRPRRGSSTRKTRYHQYIQVVERPDGRRVLHLNEGVAVHSVWRPGGNVLTGGVWDAFLALPPLLGRPLERVAILGNAAGTTARALGVYYPDAEIDGVELDPAVSRVGRRYFGLEDNPRLTVHDADARPFLRRTDAPVRPHRRRRLPPAVRAVLPRDPRILPSRPRAARSGRHRRAQRRGRARRQAARERHRDVRVAAELPQVLEWPALRFNTLVLGLTEPLATAGARAPVGEAGPADLAPLRELLARDARPLDGSGRAWTDDRAPVEWITDRMIVAYAAEGGRLDEDYLPTRPRRDRARATRRATARDRPPRGRRARAGEHARGVSRSTRRRRRSHRVRRALACTTESSSSRTRTISTK